KILSITEIERSKNNGRRMSRGTIKAQILLHLLALVVRYCLLSQCGHFIPVSKVKELFTVCFQLQSLPQFWQVGMVHSPPFLPAACYMFSKRSMRFSVDGCVAHRFLFFFLFLRFLPNGLIIYIDAVASFASWTSLGTPLILRSALIKPTGFLVNSTAVASAKYSRFLETASFTN